MPAAGLVLYAERLRQERGRQEDESAISAIGTVTLDSGAAIEEAESLYNALSSDDKKDVENRATLTSAREDYEQLRVDCVENVESLIGAIDMTDAEVSTAISAARDAYDAMPADLQEKVSNISDLERAEEAVELLITDYKTISCQKVNLFKNTTTFSTWYSDLDAAATCFLCFWLELYDSRDFPSSNISVISYIGQDVEDKRIELYSTYNKNSVIVIRYWPERGVADAGTVVTDMTAEEYMQMMEACGIIDEGKEIPIENLTRILSVMS